MQRLYDSLKESPEGGTVQNVVSELQDMNHGIPEGLQRIYDRYMADTNDRVKAAAAVNAFKIYLRQQGARDVEAQRNRGARRRTTKKRKTFKKRTTRRT